MRVIIFLAIASLAFSAYSMNPSEEKFLDSETEHHLDALFARLTPEEQKVVCSNILPDPFPTTFSFKNEAAKRIEKSTKIHQFPIQGVANNESLIQSHATLPPYVYVSKYSLRSCILTLYASEYNSPSHYRAVSIAAFKEYCRKREAQPSKEECRQ